MYGLHLVADLYDCGGDNAYLLSRQKLEMTCVAECKKAGLTPLGAFFYQFQSELGGDAGVTGTVVLAESHLAIHTWPELNQVTLDVYVCNFTQDNSSKAKTILTSLLKLFKPAEKNVQEIIRGEIGKTKKVVNL